MKNKKGPALSHVEGFTLIELIVTLAIISVLSGIILFATTQYINKGKDSNIAGNLAILIPAGEIFYNNNSYSYAGFCDPTQPNGSVFKNAISQMPIRTSGSCWSDPATATTNPYGVCCNATSQAWAACAQKFTGGNAWCVDSRGVKKEITNKACSSVLTKCP